MNPIVNLQNITLIKLLKIKNTIALINNFTNATFNHKS
jgi:hypothetical protein